MRKRLKGWLKSFLVGLVVLGFIAGPLGLIAQDGLQMKYNAIAKASIAEGRRDGFDLGKEYGERLGYRDGVKAGNAEGYLAGIDILNDPLHQAALEFEQRNPYADVLDAARMENKGETAVGYMIYIPSKMGAERVEVFISEVMRLAKQVYNGEDFFVLYLAWQDLQHGVDVVQGWAFPYAIFMEKGFETTREEGLRHLIPFPVQMPPSWHRWPGHPYEEVQITSGGSNTVPK